MINKILIFSFFLFLVACNSYEEDTDIVGTWTTVNTVDLSGINMTDEIDFYKDGSYKIRMYSNKDKMGSEIKGTYKLDRFNKTLTISTNGMSFQHKIIELKENSLKFVNQMEVKVEMKRIN